MALVTRGASALRRLTPPGTVVPVLLGLAASACAVDSAPVASAGQGSAAPTGPVIATVRVADDETFRILLTDPEDISIARKLLAGTPAPGIPNGRVVRDGNGGVNTGYGWHIGPADVEWAEVTTEVCDGLPSDVEEGAITSGRFCPWSSVAIAADAQ